MSPNGQRVVSQRLPSLLLAGLALLLIACAGMGGPALPVTSTPGSPGGPAPTSASVCPAHLKTIFTCQTPYSLRVAYGMQALTERGLTGRGQTVVDIVSFGSPTLQQDVDVFDRQFGLPPLTVQVQAPIGTAKFNPADDDMLGWAEETTLDVEIIHAVAPQAHVVVLTSPVDETEGTIGLPQFLQLEQYAVDRHLGQIFSQSYVASETTLADQVGRQLVATYSDFYRRATTQQGWTILNGSGDHGATDYNNLAATTFSLTPIVNFPADDPWVTAVGGTTLLTSPSGVHESAWSGSGGGLSKFFNEPAYQQALPQSVQARLKGQRGLPDVAANADPSSAMAIYFAGQWMQVGGTSAATPTWAGIIAVANQMAGHSLGFLNPALYTIATSAQATKDFRDITTGNNTFRQGNVSVQGYAASSGWDAVTGSGAPLCDRLLPDLIAAAKS